MNILLRTRLKSDKSETNMTDNLLFPDSNRLNPIYDVDVNGDPHRHVDYLDRDYYTASDVSAFPSGASNREIRLPHGSEQWPKVRGSMNTDTYARPMKLPRARALSIEDKEDKKKNKNAGGDLAIYAFPMKNGKFRKYSNDAEGTLDTIDHRSMDNDKDNVSKSRLSEHINETSEGDYNITHFSGRTLENETSQNLYDATNFPLPRPSALINTYL
ncbi:hypothetical protein CHS0354_003831 [Potamilus streckersoni]|uniref:Uncharacterized protein n=1 Tax=Potamilus streckersoni TaxID=2493646 RepID=A0AAE0SFP1_9BIVA|nr:hypothetical protein CHS0354_003831 [Potamilus streckersoni]